MSSELFLQRRAPGTSLASISASHAAHFTHVQVHFDRVAEFGSWRVHQRRLHLDFRARGSCRRVPIFVEKLDRDEFPGRYMLAKRASARMRRRSVLQSLQSFGLWLFVASCQPAQGPLGQAAGIFELRSPAKARASADFLVLPWPESIGCHVRTRLPSHRA